MKPTRIDNIDYFLLVLVVVVVVRIIVSEEYKVTIDISLSLKYLVDSIYIKKENNIKYNIDIL